MGNNRLNNLKGRAVLYRMPSSALADMGREICRYLAAGHNSHCCHSALPDGGYHAGTTDGAGNRTGEGNGPVRDVSGPGLP